MEFCTRAWCRGAVTHGRGDASFGVVGMLPRFVTAVAGALAEAMLTLAEECPARGAGGERRREELAGGTAPGEPTEAWCSPGRAVLRHPFALVPLAPLAAAVRHGRRQVTSGRVATIFSGLHRSIGRAPQHPRPRMKPKPGGRSGMAGPRPCAFAVTAGSPTAGSPRWAPRPGGDSRRAAPDGAAAEAARRRSGQIRCILYVSSTRWAGVASVHQGRFQSP